MPGVKKGYRVMWTRSGWYEAVRTIEVQTFEEAKAAFGHYIIDCNVEGDKIRLQKRGPNNSWDILYHFEYKRWWKRRAHLSEAETTRKLKEH